MKKEAICPHEAFILITPCHSPVETNIFQDNTPEILYILVSFWVQTDSSLTILNTTDTSNLPQLAIY